MDIPLVNKKPVILKQILPQSDAWYLRTINKQLSKKPQLSKGYKRDSFTVSENSSKRAVLQFKKAFVTVTGHLSGFHVLGTEDAFQYKDLEKCKDTLKVLFSFWSS